MFLSDKNLSATLPYLSFLQVLLSLSLSLSLEADMDSGSSGSLQSSSTGGEEEYDSRATESISAFLNSTNPRSHAGPMPNPPQQQLPQPPPSLSSSSSMFDPSLTNYFDPSFARSPPLNQNTNSLLNLDIVWSKTLRSDLNDGNFNFQSLQGTVCSSTQTVGGTLSSVQVQETGPRASVSASNDNNNSNSNNNSVPRNPKKRPRASRRAPTTVLTTDTTNFRAMVQEFTGIPAPPFAAPPFQRSRLDLFGTPTSMRSGSGFLEASPPPYLLRPFAQKGQPPPLFVSSSSSSSLFPSSMVDAIVSTTTANTSSNPPSSFGYQLIPSDLALLKQQQQQQSQNILGMNMQNPVFNFQPLFQTPPKYQLSNSAILGSKQPRTTTSLGIPSADDPSQLKMGVSENHLGSSHGQADINANLGGLQNIEWRDGDQALLRSFNGGYSSTSDFHGEKGAENLTTRSEGMVESWICSTD